MRSTPVYSVLTAAMEKSAEEMLVSPIGFSANSLEESVRSGIEGPKDLTMSHSFTWFHTTCVG